MDRSSADNKRYAIVADTYLQFPGEQVPLKAQVGNLSQTGMFLVSEITYPAGTDFNFRITAERPEDTITGRGRVAWRRQVAAGPHRPPGMGSQILRLTDDSREALERRLDASSQFELVREPPDTRSLTQEFSRQSVQDTLVTQQISRPEYFQTASPSAGRRPTRLLPAVLASVAVLVALGVGFWALRSGKLLDLDAPGAPVEAAAPTSARPSGATEPTTTSPSTPDNEAGSDGTVALPEGSPATSSSSGADGSAQALEAVRGWAAAWSEQDPDRYLRYYARSFQPGGGLTRSAWANTRRQRLTTPGFIRIDIDELEFQGNADRAVVSFRQRYSSDTFSDLVRKRLTLQVIDGDWRIVAEDSRPIG